jgi:3-oxoacyl-[acyl-carrier protein] reductase
VVGGCGGIGTALVRAALEAGLRVAVLDLPISLSDYPPAPEALRRELDATRESEVAAAFDWLQEEWDGLECLVNLAGFISSFEPVERSQVDEWCQILDGSLRSTYLVCRRAIPLLRRGSSPSIVNMSSGLGYVGRAGYGPYSAAKAAISSLTRTLAAELAPEIRVNAVAPGAVDTPFLSGGTGRGGQRGEPPSRFSPEEYLKLVPLARIGTPEEVAGPILFLAGEASKYITGEVLHINGGALMV